jgi:AAA15 family ATPase/GTPase
MLIRFTTKNYLSFKDEVTFSMIPSKGTLMKEHKTHPVQGISVLKAAVAFGANASGKSNLIKAIAFGRNMLIRGNDNVGFIDYQPFRLDANSAQSNTKMEYEIQADGKCYAYGFVFNHNRIEEEWLYRIDKKKDYLIFERNTATQTFNIDALLQDNPALEQQQFLTFLAKATPSHQLFLHEVLTRNIQSNVSNISDLNAVLNWFVSTLKIVFPNNTYKPGVTLQAASDNELKHYYSELLRYFDTGISSITLLKADVDKLDIPSDLLRIIKEDLLNPNTPNTYGTLTVGREIYLLSAVGKQLKAQKLKTVHEMAGAEKPAFFDMNDESDGTLRIIDFIPLIIDLLKGGKVFLVDEIERSLHPNLVYNIFELFFSQCADVDSQLIVSTHESSLLTQKLLRKDEIWFVSKDRMGISHLNSLEEYRVRFDKEIRKSYMLGRFKGVPALGARYQIDQLINNKEE